MAGAASFGVMHPPAGSIALQLNHTGWQWLNALLEQCSSQSDLKLQWVDTTICL